MLAEPEDPEALHQRRAAEVDRIVFEAVEGVRSLSVDDRTIIVGVSVAWARFVIQSIKREGQLPTVRLVLSIVYKFVNRAAELLLAEDQGT